MMYFANDTGAVSRSLCAYGEWAENELSFMRMMIPLGATVVDVGAYIGTHTLAFSHTVGTSGRVISIEPQFKTFEVLSKNVKMNQLPNVTLENAAAGAYSGTLEMRCIDPSRSGSFGSASLCPLDREPTGAWSASGQMFGSRAPVRLLTIDSLELSRCSLIKIDAEGFEDLVIRGAKKTIRRLSPIIYAECNSVENGLKTFALMRKFGYVVHLHVVDAYNKENFLDHKENIFESAREVALVGVSRSQLHLIENAKVRECELILEIMSADDLVLGLLHKPQYPVEVLSTGTAASTGGAAWLEEFRQSRTDGARIANELVSVRSELDRARESAVGLARQAGAAEVEHQRLANEIVSVQNELDKARERAEGLARQAEAAEVERQRLTNQLVSVQNELDRARERAEGLARQAGAADVERQRLTNQLVSVQNGMDKACADADAASARAEASMLQARFAREAADRAETAAADLASQYEYSAKRLVDAQAQVAQLRGELDMINASRSWRITKPLRTVNALLQNWR
jgi:FkbM family methyltransferase